MQFSTLAALALLGTSHASPKPVADALSKATEISLDGPQDCLASDYVKAWYALNIKEFQAPHAAYTEDQWVAYAAGECLKDNLCASFTTYLLNHDGAVNGTDLSWWVFGTFLRANKASDFYHSNDAHVSHSRAFNVKD